MSDVKTVGSRNTICSLIRNYWLRAGSPIITINMRSLKHLYTLMLMLWARTLCLWTKTHVRAGLVLSMSALSWNGIEHMDWP